MTSRRSDAYSLITAWSFLRQCAAGCPVGFRQGGWYDIGNAGESTFLQFFRYTAILLDAAVKLVSLFCE